MLIYNTTKNSWEEKTANLYRGIIYISPLYIEYGYFKITPNCVPIHTSEIGHTTYLDSIDHCRCPLYWVNSEGFYVIQKELQNNLIKPSKHTFYYPIGKHYNFSKLNLMPKEMDLDVDERAIYIKEFTFGIEYETAGGNIPWLDCLNTNLIPLYDGSITGHEYVTFPLTYKDLNVIELHTQLLNKYTTYDYNCSLHIHFGGFPINLNKIDKLYKSWMVFQWIIGKYVPKDSYYVERYKDSHKAYNKPYSKAIPFKTFYACTTGNMYVDDNSLYLPNQGDINEERKWQVFGRYHNMNLMHLISGNKHKTVEFRFFRPTTNISEIKWYIFVLGAFLKYVANTDDIIYKNITLDNILKFTYPENIVLELQKEALKLYHLHKVQVTNNDGPGICDALKKCYLSETNFKL